MKVYVTLESAVYHRERRCPSLNRVDRYWPVEEVELEEAERMRNGRDGTHGRRPCKMCSGEADDG